MSKQTQASIGALHEAISLKRKNFTFAGDVTITGDVVVKGTLFVGGNLTVTGNCTVGELICFGNVTVGGFMRFEKIHMCGLLSCASDLVGLTLCVELEADFHGIYEHKQYAATPQREAVEFASRRKEARDSFEDHIFESGNSVDVRGLLDIDDLEVHGDIVVEKDCILDDAWLIGSLEIHGELHAGELNVLGSLHAERSIMVGGNLQATDVYCRWSCEAFKIDVHNSLEVHHAIIAHSDISAGGHIKSGNRIITRGSLRAGRSIQVAASIFASTGIEAGRGYGIHAGMDVPRSLMAAHGYIATRVKPGLIKSGTFVKGKRYRELTGHQRISWPAGDDSDGISYFY
jgi:cytoskeletal protein CcmA (bactofilin family)